MTDFAPVALLTDESLVLVARKDFPADNLQQFMAYVKANAPLGAEIGGIDLSSPITPGDFETIEDVWRERLVVVFHDQKLSDSQLIAFSENFGELDPPGPNPHGQPFLKDQDRPKPCRAASPRQEMQELTASDVHSP